MDTTFIDSEDNQDDRVESEETTFRDVLVIRQLRYLQFLTYLGYNENQEGIKWISTDKKLICVELFVNLLDPDQTKTMSWVRNRILIGMDTYFFEGSGSE